MDAVPVVAAVTYSIKYSSSSSNIYTSVSIVVSKALEALIVAVVICSIKGGIDIPDAPMAMLVAIAVGVVAYGTNGSIRNTKRGNIAVLGALLADVTAVAVVTSDTSCNIGIWQALPEIVRSVVVVTAVGVAVVTYDTSGIFRNLEAPIQWWQQ
ncbi:hypothetical protein ElyMa_006914400 [Elysia marginata]|uniref:Uncharacterized protein n=1 Tax=Elysia marginata TaxID=1093978 RepID=A0AAV4JFN2_9GAST|nr:hypothetical protein ElyMa_006914400 [Elysia marginata]